MSTGSETKPNGIRVLPLGGWTVSGLFGPVPENIADLVIPASVPGCIHTDLLAAGLIADPFDGDNEAAQQWIGDTCWRYECDFTWTEDEHVRHDLVAEGLDTVATIELNGVIVGRTENQHRSYRIDLRGALVPGPNHLQITFDAPVAAAESRSSEHGPLPHVNHHPFNALRKTASNFGWDWGIDVATSGIWKPIRIEGWSGVRLGSVRPLVDVDGTTGVLGAHVELEWERPRHLARREADDAADAPEYGDRPGHEAVLEVRVGAHRARASVPEGQRLAVLTVRVPEAALWWPRGHGDHPLYDVAVDLFAHDWGSGPAERPQDTWSGRVGFRTVSLDTAADEAGAPFLIRVNGEEVVVRGANWIPDHAFVTEIDRDRYARRLTDAVEANVNLLRVWGGGIYESDDFYAECDERGVLVWQDFLFACAAYAEEAWLADDVEVEARQAVTRLSTHPSLVIWNGCNENIWGYADWGWRPRLRDRTWGDGYYRRLLPALLAELDPTRPYSVASPYSFSEYIHPNDENNGTMHIWDVWNRRDYSAYREYRPRFVSEFGFQGPPAWSTLVRVVHDEPLEPYGEQMLVHQKAQDGNLKLERGLAGHLPPPSTIDDWHWATQLNQAHAVRFGIEHFRSLAPHNSGTIVWQLNDNWPVVSWAAVDFDEHRKPLWYALRDAYRPRLATIQPRGESLALVLLNDEGHGWQGSVLIERVDFGGQVRAEFALDVDVPARGAVTCPLPEAVVAFEDPRSELIAVRFPEEAGFATAVWNAAEPIDQRLSDESFEAGSSRTDEGYLVVVAARAYTRDVFLQVDRVDPAATVDAGLVTLLPGQSAEFRVRSSVEVDASSFVARSVLRSANDLVAG